MPERSPILITHEVTRDPFEAVFVDGVTVAEARKTDAIWVPFLEMLLAEAKQRGIPEDDWPEHRHWQWAWKVGALPASTSCG
jgi:hypothetical protein